MVSEPRRRFGLLLLVLLVEAVGLSLRFDTPVVSGGWRVLLDNAAVIANVVIVGVVAAGYQFREISSPAVPRPERHHWFAWALLHLSFLVVFYTLSDSSSAGPTTLSDGGWAFAWVAIGIFCCASLVFCFYPPVVVWTTLRRHYSIFLISAAVASVAWIVGHAMQQLWRPLATGTFWVTYHLLQLAPVHVVYDSAEGVIGTDRFLVEIAPTCSGYEGIGLCAVFVSLNLYLFRHSLRFPQALLLYPIGAAAVYFANSLRLGALVLVGHYSSGEAAVAIFHSQAGWVLFLMVSLGVLVASRNISFFNAAARVPEVTPPGEHLAWALLVPFLVLLGSGMLLSTALAGAAWADALVVLATGASLWCYRSRYRGLRWSCSWSAPVIGVAVLGLWLVLVPGDPQQDALRSAALSEMPGWLALSWMVLRVVRSVIIVPIVEELAFRNYLLRKLTSRAFETVSADRFSWLALVCSSSLFGLLHGHWLAGSLAGVAFGLAQRKSRSTGGAIVAHAVCNGLIALVVLTRGEWSLWP